MLGPLPRSGCIWFAGLTLPSLIYTHIGTGEFQEKFSRGTFLARPFHQIDRAAGPLALEDVGRAQRQLSNGKGPRPEENQSES